MLNALGDAIGVLAFAVGMLLEFIGHALAMDAGGHEVMVHVAQHADDLGGQGFVENRDGLLDIAFVAGGDGAFFNLIESAAADLLYIADESLHRASASGSSRKIS